MSLSHRQAKKTVEIDVWRDQPSVRGGVRRVRVHFRLLLHIAVRIIVVVHTIVVLISRRALVAMVIRLGPVVSLAVVSVASVAPSAMRFRFSRRAGMSVLRCARWYAPSGRKLFPVEERNKCLVSRQVVRRKRKLKVRKVNQSQILSPPSTTTRFTFATEVHRALASRSRSRSLDTLPLALHAHARSTRTRSLVTPSRARPHGKHRSTNAGSVIARRPRDGRPPPYSSSGAVDGFLALVLALTLARQRITIAEPCVLFCCRSLRR